MVTNFNHNFNFNIMDGVHLAAAFIGSAVAVGSYFYTKNAFGKPKWPLIGWWTTCSMLAVYVIEMVTT